MHRRLIPVPALVLVGVLLVSMLFVSGLPAQETGEFVLNEWGMPYPTYTNPIDRAEGPFERLVIRNATIIDGTGAPPMGPYDILIEDDRIAAIYSVGLMGLPNPEAQRVEDVDFEIDATGMTVTPGFVNSHGHLGPYSVPTYDMSYIYKLWLAHGITTTAHRRLAARPRLDGQAQGRGVADGSIEGPDLQAYAFIASQLPGRGVDARCRCAPGFATSIRAERLGAEAPQRSRRARAGRDRGGQVELGMQTTMHHAQVFTPQATALDTARWGLGSMEHFWYGLPEALFTDLSIQSYPEHHNYDDEQHRFRGRGAHLVPGRPAVEPTSGTR